MTDLRVEGSEGIGLAVTVTGPPDAPVWLHAHGAGSSGRFVQSAFSDPVHEAGWRLATWDLRGHGDSDPVVEAAGHAVEQHVHDLCRVAGVVGADVIGGVSLGAHAAVLASPHLDVRGVVACLPAWTGKSSLGAGVHAGVAAMVRDVGVPLMIENIRHAVDMALWLRDTLVTDFSRCVPESLAAALTALDGGRAPDADDLAALPCPLALVGWPDDPGHPLEVAEQWSELSGAPLVTLAIDDVTSDPWAMGRAAVTALRDAGVSPP